MIRIIIYQQLSTKVANIIYGRFAELVGSDLEMEPDQILAHPPEILKTAGLSRQKAEYISGIAQQFHNLDLTIDRLAAMDADDIRNALLPIKGVGPWSVDMFLMFHLCHPDVFPTGDLGIQNAYARLTRSQKPKASEMLEFSGRWRPYRTVASHYLWRSLDEPPLAL